MDTVSPRLPQDKPLCQDCQQPKPIKGKGLCNACHSRQWRHAHPERSKEFSQKNYYAHKEEDNRRSHQNYRKHREERLTKQREYDARRYEEKKAYSRRYQKEHRVEMRAYHKQYQPGWQARNHEKVVGYTKAWRMRHPEVRVVYLQRYLKENRTILNERLRIWAKNNPEKKAEQGKRRRAAKNGATIIDFTAAQWRALKEAYQHHCAYCDKYCDKLTRDHVIPITRGGNHTLSNIVPACQSCNSRKKQSTWTPNPPKQPIQLTESNVRTQHVYRASQLVGEAEYTNEPIFRTEQEQRASQ